MCQYVNSLIALRRQLNPRHSHLWVFLSHVRVYTQISSFELLGVIFIFIIILEHSIFPLGLVTYTVQVKVSFAIFRAGSKRVHLCYSYLLVGGGHRETSQGGVFTFILYNV